MGRWVGEKREACIPTTARHHHTRAIHRGKGKRLQPTVKGRSSKQLRYTHNTLLLFVLLVCCFLLKIISCRIFHPPFYFRPLKTWKSVSSSVYTVLIGFCGCSNQATLGYSLNHIKSLTGRHFSRFAAYPSVSRRRRVSDPVSAGVGLSKMERILPRPGAIGTSVFSISRSRRAGAPCA